MVITIFCCGSYFLGLTAAVAGVVLDTEKSLAWTLLGLTSIMSGVIFYLEAKKPGCCHDDEFGF